MSEGLPLLCSSSLLLVAGIDDLLSRSSNDNADSCAPCEDNLLLLLHSAAHAMTPGARLFLFEPT